MRKPSIGNSYPLSAQDTAAMKQNVETITGRAGDRCDLDGLDNLTVSNPPTQEQVEFLRAQLAILVRRLEE
jgi:hypothetical protein